MNGLTMSLGHHRTCESVMTNSSETMLIIIATSRSSAPSLGSYDPNDKENCRPVHPRTRAYKRKCASRAMADNEETPRPSKRQSTRQYPMRDTPSLPRLSSVSSSVHTTSTDLESHQSGRVSTTKQMATLKDAEEPTLFYDFGCSKARMAKDAEAIRRGVQPLADHRGILGHKVRDNVIWHLSADLWKRKELAQYSSDKSPLHSTERERFAYPEAHDPAYSRKLGTVVPLKTVQDLVEEAMDCETNQAHEDVWNVEVHRPLISTAKTSSLHAQALRICSLWVHHISKPVPILPQRIKY